jgi:HSP20 family protein
MHRLIKIRVYRDRECLEERVRGLLDTMLHFSEAAPGFRPAADLYETAQGLTLRLEVAGVTPDDLAVALSGRELVIRGQRRLACGAGPARFYQHEMGSGAFERSFILPIPIDPQGVTAKYIDGILEVHLPRQGSRRIPVIEVPEG